MARRVKANCPVSHDSRISRVGAKRRVSRVVPAVSCAHAGSSCRVLAGGAVQTRVMSDRGIPLIAQSGGHLNAPVHFRRVMYGPYPASCVDFCLSCRWIFSVFCSLFSLCYVFFFRSSQLAQAQVGSLRSLQPLRTSLGSQMHCKRGVSPPAKAGGICDTY